MVLLLLGVIYLAFISLGLPDSILGSAWPAMYREFGAPLSYAGYVSMVIAFGTIVSSLLSDKVTRRWGAGKVTAGSVAMTAVALFGFSFSTSYWELLLWAVPYGLGAGSVDAALNNYVALHYESRHMSWLHCMWGIGAATGPLIMGQALSRGLGWPFGYRFIGCLQVVLALVMIASLPLWKRNERETELRGSAPSMFESVSVAGVIEVMIFFFGYCAFEQAAGLWASSFLNIAKSLPVEEAAGKGSLFFIGITGGRALSGFATMKFSDHQMIIGGLVIIGLGLLMLFLPLGTLLACCGLVTIGLGCAPIYPCIIHSTPFHFGAERSQAIIGLQMASAYAGTLLMPPLFGLLADHLGAGFLPYYLLGILLLMAVMYARLRAKVNKRSSSPEAERENGQ